MRDRDIEVANFINNIQCNSDTISAIFFPSRTVANRRLAYLFNYGYVDRTRDHACEPYFYFKKGIKPTKQRQHSDLIARAYFWILCMGYNIIEYYVQKKDNDIIPDLICRIEDNNKQSLIAIEIDIANNNIEKTIGKYEYQNQFSKVVIFTKKTNITANNKLIIFVNLNDLYDLKELKKLIKQK